MCPAARAGWGWSRVGGVPGLGVLDFKPLVGVVGGLSTQRGVAGRECMRMEWWLCMGRRRGGGRRTSYQAAALYPLAPPAPTVVLKGGWIWGGIGEGAPARGSGRRFGF